MKRKRRATRGELKKRNKKIIILGISLLFVLATGYGAFQTTLNLNVTGKIRINSECVEGKVWEFNQEDYGQEFRVPCSGEYKVELWGASGGYNDVSESGKGAYTSGNINFKINKKYYIYVGASGKMQEERDSSVLSQTFNGGGSGYYGGQGGLDAGWSPSGGGGGSSFISGHEGCDAISEQSTEDNIIHTGQSIHYSSLYFTETVMIDGAGYKWTDHKLEDLGVVGMPTHSGIGTMTGNVGDGFAKITLLTRKQN